MPDSATSQNNDNTDQLYNKSHNYTEVKRAHALAYVVSMAMSVHIGGSDKYRSTIFFI